MTVAERYLELALRIGRHDDEVVEAYRGPSELEARIAAEEPHEPARLRDDADALISDVAGADLDPERRRWLEGQVRALHTVTRRLAGEDLPYVEEVELLFGITPRWYDESDYERGQQLLDDVLPGSGDVRERLRHWLDTTAVPKDVLLPAVTEIAAELRTRTGELLGLPDGEEIELELVSDKPYGGFNLWLGGVRSRITVNTDLPFPAAGLVHFVAHEGYPGHHTECSWKDEVLVRERGQLEATLMLSRSPAAVVAEAIAEVAAEIVCPSDEQELIVRVLEPLGVWHDAELAARVQEGRDLLGTIGSNLELLRLDRGKSRDEVREYAERWSPQPAERIEKTLDWIDNPDLRGYIHCYPEGLRLGREFVRGEPARFKQMLVGQLLPADLAAGQLSGGRT
jgi:hypothetical protein